MRWAEETAHTKEQVNYLEDTSLQKLYKRKDKWLALEWTKRKISAYNFIVIKNILHNWRLKKDLQTNKSLDFLWNTI